MSGASPDDPAASEHPGFHPADVDMSTSALLPSSFHAQNHDREELGGAAEEIQDEYAIDSFVAEPDPLLASQDDSGPSQTAEVGSNLVRVSSNGSSIDSGGEDYADRERDAHDHEAQDGRVLFTIEDDNSTPDEDELQRLANTAEYNALTDYNYFATTKTFFDLKDPEYVAQEHGQIDWAIDRLNGTKEQPNKDWLLRSPVVNIGGYDWQVKLFPQGNGTQYISVYVENISLSASPGVKPKTEQQTGAKDGPALPYLGPTPAVTGPKPVSAQFSVVMYNPSEPREWNFKTDAHRFCHTSADWGWTRFSSVPWFEIHHRQFRHRAPLLKGDRLALKCFIRTVADETNSLWEHTTYNNPYDSLSVTGLRGIRASPHPRSDGGLVAAVAVLLHFKLFRQFLYSLPVEAAEERPLLTYLQKLLFQMRTRRPLNGLELIDFEEGYRILGGHRGDQHHDRDVIFQSEALRLQIDKELVSSCQKSIIEGILGPVTSRLYRENTATCTDATETKAALPPPPINLRVQVRGMSSVRQAVEATDLPTWLKHESPALLAVELDRQVFDRDTRRWTKVLDRVRMNEALTIGSNATQYTLYAFAADRESLHSGLYNLFFRGDNGKWYTYEDSVQGNRVRCLTRKKAVNAHEGSSKARETDSCAYVVYYIRNDVLADKSEEKWDVPRWIEVSTPSESSGARESSVLQTPQLFAPVHPVLANAATTAEDDGPDTPMSDVDDEQAALEKRRQDSGHDAAPPGEGSNRRPHSDPNLERVVRDYYGSEFYDGDAIVRDGEMKYHGSGRRIGLNGDEYVGEFRLGERVGDGKMVYQNGDVYVGEWKGDKRDGQGTHTELRTGNTYTGGWAHDKRHGRGTTHWQRSPTDSDSDDESKRRCHVCYERQRNA
ncbi:hypothetical protein LTR28_003659, partial [Elasticomyces elasticus]